MWLDYRKSALFDEVANGKHDLVNTTKAAGRAGGEDGSLGERSDFMLVALRPTQQTVDIVASLRGRWHGSYAMCLCPAHADATPSLSVRQGQRGILVHCFAGCDNVVVLRAIAQLTPRANTPMPRFSEARVAPSIQWIWEESGAIRGTIGETYLRLRNLPTNLPDVRFHPRCPFGRKPHAKFKPALIVAVRLGSELAAIQRIALKANGDGHVGKFMLGRPGQAAWSPPFEGNELALAEGMEDAVAYTKLRGIPCWSSLGDQRIALLRVPGAVTKLHIATDNDQAGDSAAERAFVEHAAPDRVISRDRPPSGFKDWAKFNESRSWGRQGLS
jgi:hypothetical protein